MLTSSITLIVLGSWTGLLKENTLDNREGSGDKSVELPEALVRYLH